LKHYIDTSILAAYYCPEPLSKKAESLLRSQKLPSISTLTELELFSAISRKIREGSILKADGDRIAARFLSHINGGFFNYLSVEDHHYRLARDWIGLFNTALRTLDALHLAVASMEELTLVTADKVLAKSGEALGVPVILVE
jgi:uncharacterized protein